MTKAPVREMAIRVVDNTRYMTIGTAWAESSARVSPVYVSHDGYIDFYWASSPDATH
jgi:hypothetical protein